MEAGASACPTEDETVHRWRRREERRAQALDSGEIFHILLFVLVVGQVCAQDERVCVDEECEELTLSEIRSIRKILLLFTSGLNSTRLVSELHTLNDLMKTLIIITERIYDSLLISFILLILLQYDKIWNALKVVLWAIVSLTHVVYQFLTIQFSDIRYNRRPNPETVSDENHVEMPLRSIT